MGRKETDFLEQMELGRLKRVDVMVPVDRRHAWVGEQLPENWGALGPSPGLKDAGHVATIEYNIRGDHEEIENSRSTRGECMGHDLRGRER